MWEMEIRGFSGNPQFWSAFAQQQMARTWSKNKTTSTKATTKGPCRLSPRLRCPSLIGVQGHVKGRNRTRCNNSQPMAISPVHWRPRKIGRTCMEDNGLQWNEIMLTSSRHFPCSLDAFQLECSRHAHCSMWSLLRGKWHSWGGWAGRLSPDEKPKQKPWWSGKPLWVVDIQEQRTVKEAGDLASHRGLAEWVMQAGSENMGEGCAETVHLW